MRRSCRFPVGTHTLAQTPLTTCARGVYGMSKSRHILISGVDDPSRGLGRQGACRRLSIF